MHSQYYVFRIEVCDLKHTLHVWLTAELIQLQQLTNPRRFDMCGPQIGGNNVDSLNHMELPSWRMPLTHAAQTRTTLPYSAHDFEATGLLSSTDFCFFPRVQLDVARLMSDRLKEVQDVVVCLYFDKRGVLFCAITWSVIYCCLMFLCSWFQSHCRCSQRRKKGSVT